jgi:hypothetical protein
MSTGNNYQYQSDSGLNLAHRTNVEFQVKASNDAQVLLETGRGKIFEIVIGGWSNQHSVIRRTQQGPSIASYQGAVVSSSQFKRFVLEWDTSRILRLYQKMDNGSQPETVTDPVDEDCVAGRRHGPRCHDHTTMKVKNGSYMYRLYRFQGRMDHMICIGCIGYL